MFHINLEVSRSVAIPLAFFHKHLPKTIGVHFLFWILWVEFRCREVITSLNPKELKERRFLMPKYMKIGNCEIVLYRGGGGFCKIHGQSVSKWRVCPMAFWDGGVQSAMWSDLWDIERVEQFDSIVDGCS